MWLHVLTEQQVYQVNVNGARGIYRVNGGRSEAGTSTRFGNRDAKRRDLRAAFGLPNG